MMSFAPNSLLERLRWRYAVKKFDSSRKLTTEDWAALRQALVLTPSSYGLQPWQFILVQDATVRRRLTPASWNQSQVEDCSHYVVFCRLRRFSEEHIDRYVKRIASVRNQSLDQLGSYRKMMVQDLIVAGRSKTIEQWASNQVYIALGNLMTSAAVMGIDTCPMEGIVPDEYDAILGLENENLRSLVACAVGYRSDTDMYATVQKVRFEESDVIKVI